eukprot:2053150-Prymnesium_polylepis.1
MPTVSSETSSRSAPNAAESLPLPSIAPADEAATPSAEKEQARPVEKASEATNDEPWACC